MFVELQVYFPLGVRANTRLLSVHLYNFYFLISVVCLALFTFEILFCIVMHSTSPYIASCLDSGYVILEHQIIFLYTVPSFLFNHYCWKNHPTSLCFLIFREYVSFSLLLYVLPFFRNTTVNHRLTVGVLSFIFPHSV
jgi:hypothetical protein